MQIQIQIQIQIPSQLPATHEGASSSLPMPIMISPMMMVVVVLPMMMVVPMMIVVPIMMVVVAKLYKETNELHCAKRISL